MGKAKGKTQTIDKSKNVTTRRSSRKKPLSDSQIISALNEEPDDVSAPAVESQSTAVSAPSTSSGHSADVFQLADVVTAGGNLDDIISNQDGQQQIGSQETNFSSSDAPEYTEIDTPENNEEDPFAVPPDEDANGSDSCAAVSEYSDLSSIAESESDSIASGTEEEPRKKKIKKVSNRRKLKGNRGRFQGQEWEFFHAKVEGAKRVRCRNCNEAVSARAPRLRNHLKNCRRLPHSHNSAPKHVSVPVADPCMSASVSVPSPSAEVKVSSVGGPKRLCGTKITQFLDRMSSPDQEDIDNLLGKFIFSCNLPFSIVENPEFVAFITKLRPAYEIPREKAVGSKILDRIYGQCLNEVAANLKDQNVVIQQDGWSTRQNAPVIAHSVSTGTRNYYVSATATGTNSKTASYCQALLESEVECVEQKYECKVIGSVTDNCATMRRMREEMSLKRPDMLNYGCHSHLLNLVGQELTPDELKSDVVEVQKFFRNHHFPAASLKKKQGNRPVIPGDTRWNSQLDCFESFLNNQAKYLEISREPDAKIPQIIKTLIRDNDFYERVNEAVRILLPVARALDQLQGDSSTLGDAVAIWLKLDSELGNYSENRVFQEKYQLAMTPIAIAAYMLHPKYKGRDLPLNLKNVGDKFLAEINPYFVIVASELKIKSEHTFPKALLEENVCTRMHPANWWKSVNLDVRLPSGIVELAAKLMILPSSTGGLERSFSVLGRIMTNARSRLGVEKASKLCFIYSYLKSRNSSLSLFNDSDLD